MMTDVGDVGSAWRRLMRLGVYETTITRLRLQREGSGRRGGSLQEES